jgi:DNA-binding NtrC family response regulator
MRAAGGESDDVHDDGDGTRLTGKPAVLCVDDDLSLLAGLARVLARRYRVTCAGTAEEALAALTAGDFTAMVTDLHLGELSGIDLCARARVLAPRTATLLLSGHYTDEEVDAAMRAGAYHLLHKPCRGADLVAAIDEAIEGAPTAISA